MKQPDPKTLMSIYNAAISNDHWDIALDHVTKEVGSKSAALFVVEETHQLLDKSSRFLREADPALLRYYFENHFEHDAWARERLATTPALQLVADIEIWPDDGLRQRADYAYLEKNLGIGHKMAVRLNDCRQWTDCIAFQFPASHSQIPESASRIAAPLLPHIAKAVEVNRLYRALHLKYRAVLAALDHVQVGMCVVRSDKQVIVSNLEARHTFASGPHLKMNRFGRLRTPNVHMQSQLDVAIDNACSTANGQDKGVSTQINLPRAKHEAPLLVDIIPLRDVEAELSRDLAGCLVRIADPERLQHLPLDRLARLYQFSKAEMDVCRLLLQGKTNQEIAEQRDTQPETIKTQVRSILRKTNCARRLDLLRLAMKIETQVE